MKRTVMILCTVAIFAAAGVLLSASLPQVPSGTWIALGPMNSARSGASAVLLQDGRILVSGGNDSNGPSNTAELFGANGSFSMDTPMNVTRSGHVAVVLQDGRVLIAGGTISGGGVTNSAEIYDPAANSWTNVSGGMLEARSGQTATLLNDGRVLLAGGAGSSGTVSLTAEVFDPVAQTFALAGQLSSARKSHAAALLSDGRVLIVGGSDGTNVLASSDIYNPTAGTISAGPNLSAGRQALSATTLLDGRVLVAGGNNIPNGSTTPVDLASAEILDAGSTVFSPAPSALFTARSGQQAFLLPHNNSVLIVGGTSNGTAIASAELYIPWGGSSQAGVFQSTGSMSAARSSVTGSALQQDGLLLVAGGKDASGAPLSSSELYGFATVKTDAADYPPGTTVNISGSGWQPGETVILTLVESPLIDTHGPFTAIADANGNISDSSFVTDTHDVNIKFSLTAVGLVSQARTTFTDAPAKVGSVSVSSQVGALTFGTAGSGTYTVTVSRGSSGAFTANLCVNTSLPSGASASFLPPSVSFTAADNSKSSTLTISTTAVTPAGTPSFTVRAFNTSGGGTCTSAGGDFAEGSGTLAVAKATPTITWANPADITYGTSLSATQLNAAASVPGSFVYTPSSGTVLNVGSGQTLHVAFTPTDTTNYNSTFTDVTINVNAKMLTASIVGNPTKPYDGNTSATLNSSNFSLTGLVGSESFTVTKTSGTYNSKDVMTANNLTASLASGDFTPANGALASNYVLPTTASGAGHITSANATWTTNANSKTYGDLDPSPLTTGSGSNFVAADGVTATYSRAAGETVLGGPYHITATLAPAAALSNYNITNAGADFTINARNATWTTNPNSKTYGDLDPSSLTTGSGSNFVAADGVTATYSRAAGETVLGGPYHITATLAPAAALSNYNITNTGADFTINARNATWTTNSNSKTYDDPDPNPLTTGSGTNFVAADGVTATYSRAAGETVQGGPYHITATLSPSGVLSNYNITNTGASFTINKALLTVTAENKMMILHGVVPMFTASYSGFKLTDTFATAMTGSPSLTATATTTSPVGSYMITAALGTLAANNYTFKFVDGTLTIQYASGGICDGDVGHQILQPINVDGTSVFKQGSTTPAKFRVCDANGQSIGNPEVVVPGGFVLYQTQKGTITNVDEVPDSTTPDTAFRWDPTGQQWIFNISTKYAPVNVANQTYYFRISLNDGTSIMFQYGLK